MELTTAATCAKPAAANPIQAIGPRLAAWTAA